jgi:hypothetical protein
MQQSKSSDVWTEQVGNWMVAHTSFDIAGSVYAREDGLYALTGGGVVVGIRNQRVLMLAVKTPEPQARIVNICRSFEIDASFLEVLKLLYSAKVLLCRETWPIDPVNRSLFTLIDWSVRLTGSPVYLAPALGVNDVRSHDTKLEVA